MCGLGYLTAVQRERRRGERAGERGGGKENTWKRGGSNPGFMVLAKILHFPIFRGTLIPSICIESRARSM